MLEDYNVHKFKFLKIQVKYLILFIHIIYFDLTEFNYQYLYY